MRTCGEDNRLYALGGKGQGRDLKVFDLNADEPVFKAKNVCVAGIGMRAICYEWTFAPASSCAVEWLVPLGWNYQEYRTRCG
jgi:hypothetical protein